MRGEHMDTPVLSNLRTEFSPANKAVPSSLRHTSRGSLKNSGFLTETRFNFFNGKNG